MDVTGFITLIQNYALWGYVIMFLIAFFEVLVVVGAFFPGQNLIIASGFIAQQGGFDISILTLLVFVGTLFGNLVSYYLGKIYGDRFLIRFGKYFYVEEKHLKVAKAYMKQHLGKTLIIGRFNHIIRSFIPFVAGTSEVGIIRFLLYNVIGAALWTSVFVGVGYILGRTYEVAFGYASALSIIAFILISVLFYWFYKKTYKKIDILKN